MRSLFLIVLSFMMLVANGQTFIQSRNLQVTMNKTTNLIFPSAISSVDRGSVHIAVLQSTGNILRVKADTIFKDTTNLTVVTADGKLYSFLVCYVVSPAILNINLGATENIFQDTALHAFAVRIKQRANFLNGIRYGVGKVWLSLLGVYTNGRLIACKLRIENASPLSFEIGRIGATLGAKRAGKRRAVQEQALPILLTDMETSLVRERQAVVAIIIIPKSGLAPGQSLVIQVGEKGGERNLLLSIANRYLLNAKLISSL